MTALNAVVIINEITGQPLMVVVPDYEAQLVDPAYNPPGTKQISIPLENYKTITHEELKAVVDSAVTALEIGMPIEDGMS